MMARTTIAISGILLAGFVIPAQAQLDTLGNGMSDVWERKFNKGELFDPENPDHHPDADPDGDGWTNIQEYIAGTDPFSANPPEGFIPTYITYLENQEMPDPDDYSQTIITDVAIISWDTIPGKTYTLWSSPDLAPNSWVIADGPVMGDGIPWASPILLGHAFEETPERLFWRLEIQDPHIDSDGDGLTNYEEWLLGSDPDSAFSSETGIPDLWIAQHLGHIPGIFQTFNPNDEAPGGGASILDHYLSGSDPNTPAEDAHIPWFILHGNGPEDVPISRPRQVTLPAGTKAIMLVATASSEYDFYTNPNNNQNQYNDLLEWDIQTNMGDEIKNKVDVNANHENWNQHGKTIPGMINTAYFQYIGILEAPSDEDLVIDMTLTATNISDGNYPSEVAVAPLPEEITAAFGEGPDIPPNAGNQSSRELLEAYLDGIKVARQGDVWAVNGKDTQGNDKIWVVEIVSDEDGLKAALSSDGRYVVFDGHSNFGFGPNFLGYDQINRISDFTNFGARYTDVPLTFRKLIRKPANPNDPVNFGYPYGNLVVPDDEIAAAPTNYKPLPINKERFPNIDGVGVGQVFPKQGQGFDTFHYRIEGGAKRLMIDARKCDLPANLAYKTFFYNACRTGPDYIENFKHGDFIYTNKVCFVHQGTKIYVQGVIEGKTTEQIMPLLNVPDVGGGAQGEVVYEFERF